MKLNITTTAIIAFFIIIIAFFYLQISEIKNENAMLRDLISRNNSTSASGKNKQTDPYISGPVKNRILKGYTEIKKCYAVYLDAKPKKIEGKIKIDWQIDTDGTTISPEVIFSDFQNKPFESCITKKISTWEFPHPIVKKYVNHLFKFSDKGK